ncbi:11507_t:CDS:1, partial [Scutellospora calospora]
MESVSTQVSQPLLNSKQKPLSYQSVGDNEVDEKCLSQWDMIKLTLCMAGLQFA